MDVGSYFKSLKKIVLELCRACTEYFSVMYTLTLNLWISSFPIPHRLFDDDDDNFHRLFVAQWSPYPFFFSFSVCVCVTCNGIKEATGLNEQPFFFFFFFLRCFHRFAFLLSAFRFLQWYLRGVWWDEIGAFACSPTPPLPSPHFPHKRTKKKKNEKRNQSS